MPRARKKPIEIEYVQFTGDNWKETWVFCGTRPAGYNPAVSIPNFGPAKDWIVEFERDEAIVGAVYSSHHKTWVGVKVGDYIIKGAEGEFYPHDGALFWKNYDPVVEDHSVTYNGQTKGHYSHTHYNDHEPLQ